jgi:Fe2+ or Zn2+ uptake regulation protein
MAYYKTSYYYQILDQYDIKATAIRVSLLRIIYGYETAAFTIDQVLDGLKEDWTVVNENYVMSNLRLFKMRGLLTVVDYEIKHTPGRPMAIFKLNRKI